MRFKPIPAAEYVPRISRDGLDQTRIFQPQLIVHGQVFNNQGWSHAEVLSIQLVKNANTGDAGNIPPQSSAG